MSKYTTQVRWIVENASDPDLPVDEQITAAAPKIFNFDFPMYDEAERQSLEEAILLHYYTQEIGFETVGLWKLKLKTRLREIMPYYTELWKTTQNQYNYLQDVDVSETYTSNREGTVSATQSNTSTVENKTQQSGSQYSNATNDTVTSDLPQVNLAQPINNLDYATNEVLQKNNNAGGSNSTTDENGSTSMEGKNSGTSNDTETSTRHRAGLTGARSQFELLQEYRDSLLKIPMMIIDELKDLFMALW